LYLLLRTRKEYDIKYPDPYDPYSQKDVGMFISLEDYGKLITTIENQSKSIKIFSEALKRWTERVDHKD
jgi:hypothetical protein